MISRFTRAILTSVFIVILFVVGAAAAKLHKRTLDWSAHCTQELKCQVRTSVIDANKIRLVGFNRSIEANATVAFFLETSLNPENVTALSVQVDDAVAYDLEPSKAVFLEFLGLWYFPGDEIEQQIISAMLDGEIMTLRFETPEENVETTASLSGFQESVRFVDEVQKRVGNRDALVALGSGDPKPATTRAKILKSVKDLPGLVRKTWQEHPNACNKPDVGTDRIDLYGGLQIRFESNVAFYALPCGLNGGVYNRAQLIIFHDSRNNVARVVTLPKVGSGNELTANELAYNMRWDEDKATLTSIFWNRRQGDCGVQQIWKVTDVNNYSSFDLIEERRKENCDGHKDEWPIVWAD